MHQNVHLHRRVLHGALVRLERSAAKVARCVLRGERSREAPDLPGGSAIPLRGASSRRKLLMKKGALPDEYRGSRRSSPSPLGC